MPTTPKSEQEIKALEQTERQIELDAIALYVNNREFPSVSNAFAREAAAGHDPGAAAPDVAR